MGGCMSKRKAVAPSAAVSPNNSLLESTELCSYEAACRVDKDVRSFHNTLQARTNNVINSLVADDEVRALSFDSLKEITGCLLEINQDVVKVILECKKDIWKSQEIFDLIGEYFESSLQTMDFCAVMEKCLKRTRDNQSVILVALQQFDQESEAGVSKYVRTLEELKNIKAAGNPFTEEFFHVFQSVYKQQVLMLEKLQQRKEKLDKKIKYRQTWRKVSSVIFIAAFAAVIICSIVAAAIAALPVAAALEAASSIPLGSIGKWIDSLWTNHDNVLKGQKEVITSMQAGSYVAIKDLVNIRVLIDRLENEIEALMKNVDIPIEKEAVEIAVEEIKKKLGVCVKNAEELETQAETCSREIRRATTMVLQRIINIPTTKDNGLLSFL